MSYFKVHEFYFHRFLSLPPPHPAPSPLSVGVLVEGQRPKSQTSKAFELQAGIHRRSLTHRWTNPDFPYSPYFVLHSLLYSSDFPYINPFGVKRAFFRKMGIFRIRRRGQGCYIVNFQVEMKCLTYPNRFINEKLKIVFSTWKQESDPTWTPS